MTPAYRHRQSHLARVEERYFYLFISPWILGFFVFSAGPILASLVLSFTEYNIASPPRFVGLENISRLLHDPLFWQALKVTSLYSLFSVPLGIIVSLIVALLLNQKVYGLALFRTIYYSPSVVSGVAVSLLWMWIFNPEFGILNYILHKLFHIQGPMWLMSEQWVIPALVLMSLWGVGGSIVIYLAGLQGIPTQLYEAAEIDGANSWYKFRSITLPLMSPVIFFNLIMGIIGSFQVFTQAYVMTGGGPHYASLFYVLYLYQHAFQYFRMGYASALAWVLFLIILILTLAIFRSSSLWVYYEATTTRR
ncbi:MAG: sugar ABC transporter permease [Firmicutes bacterium]|nr:sugar ABC transporter permease [Bacillota bacterium]